MSCHVWKIPRHRGTRLRFFKKHALVTCFWQRHKIHLLVGRHSLSYLLHWRQISFCTIFLLTENAGLFKRQEGRGLFPESGWSHAVMQVTGKTHCFFTYSHLIIGDRTNVNPECNWSTHIFRNIRLQWLSALFQCSGSECFWEAEQSGGAGHGDGGRLR